MSAYIYSPLQSTSFGSNTVINEKDTTTGVFYNNKVSDFSKSAFDGLNSQNKKNDGTNNDPEPKKDKKDDDTIYPISNGIISGYKINDTNNNGIWDVGENAIEGGEIRLIGLAGIKIKNETITDKNGFYAFTGLPEGGYIVKEKNQMGWKHTNSTVKKIELEIGENSINNNFTNIRKKSYCKAGIISGYKINDINSNGEWNKGEETLSGWTINLIKKYENDEEISEETNFYEFTNIPGADGCENGKKKIPKWTFDLMKRGEKHIKYETVTDENGYYEFTSLQKGKYIVKEEMQNGWINTSSVDRLVKINHNDMFNVNFTNRNITATPPQPSETTLSISGYKINDSDGTGIYGWAITLSNGSITTTTHTNQTGYYKFTSLANGNYIVTEETRDGWTNVTPSNISIQISGQNISNQNFRNKRVQTSLSQASTTSGSSSCGRNVNTKEKYSNIKLHEYSKEIYI
ncbi:MAG: hypothetical protein D4R88_08590 [Methanosarcinales archaeon]|nr:MAG: hypothetical protein D4R88_08590 [Methanosarcinales archaeon]